MISISGDSLDPRVVRYSDVVTDGKALVPQYCVGHNKNLTAAPPKCC